MTPTVARAQLRQLTTAAARAGLTLRNCGAGGLVLVGPGWLAHSDDPAELLDALKDFQDRAKTDSRPTTFINYFFERHHHGTDRI